MCHECRKRPRVANEPTCLDCRQSNAVMRFKDAYGVTHETATEWAIACLAPDSECEACGLLVETLRVLNGRVAWAVKWAVGCAWRLTPDHINGDPTDNRRLNIRFLCLGCNAARGKDRTLAQARKAMVRRWNQSGYHWNEVEVLNKRTRGRLGELPGAETG